MSFFLRTIITIISLFIYSNAFAVTPTQALEQNLSQLHSMQANFTQVVTNARGHVLQKSSGEMALLRPGKFRWVSNSPTRQLIVADGKKLWIFDKDLEQVTVKPLSKSLDNSPGMFLSNSPDNLSEYYNVTSEKNPNNFLITPKAEDAQFTSIELQYSNNELVFMQLHDQLGQTTKLAFTHIKVNSELNPKLFMFHPPKGVDVVAGD
ncbi:MAG: outer membrane lipoprotein chaperone LolA [Proteobacteria bacterium]|nr:outer membrane lipoprotein chaperone LolA [Pseudomonadota bacterium]